jgi:oligoendopeptidase F
MTTEELAQRHLGADLTRPEFWEDALSVVLDDVKEFLRLTAE